MHARECQPANGGVEPRPEWPSGLSPSGLPEDECVVGVRRAAMTINLVKQVGDYPPERYPRNLGHLPVMVRRARAPPATCPLACLPVPRAALLRCHCSLDGRVRAMTTNVLMDPTESPCGGAVRRANVFELVH
eukprot:scaffold7820_cov363-Prasinococcus_capsulatus_cf.AAC.3